MRKERFTFLCSKDERHLITVLAQFLQRSQGDAVRFVITREARKLSAREQTKFPKTDPDHRLVRDEG